MRFTPQSTRLAGLVQATVTPGAGSIKFLNLSAAFDNYSAFAILQLAPALEAFLPFFSPTFNINFIVGYIVLLPY